MSREWLLDKCAQIVFYGLALTLPFRLAQWAEAQEGQMSDRDIALNEIRAVNLNEPHDPVHCFQVREHGETRVCITEAEWMRQHLQDAINAHLEERR